MYKHTLKFNLNYFKDQTVPDGDLFFVLYTDSEAPISSFEYLYNIFKTNSYYGYPLTVFEGAVTFSQKAKMSFATNFIGHSQASMLELKLHGPADTVIAIPMTSGNSYNIEFSDIFAAKDAVEKLSDTWHHHTFTINTEDDPSLSASLSVWTPYNDLYTTTNNDAIYTDAVVSPFSKTVRLSENGEVVGVDDVDAIYQDFADDEFQKFNLLVWEGLNTSFDFTDLSIPASTKEILDFGKEFPGVYTPTIEEIESSYKGYKQSIAYTVDGDTWTSCDINSGAAAYNYSSFTYSCLLGLINRINSYDSENNPITYKTVLTRDNVLYFVDANENIQLIEDVKENE